ncbi:unnamed protein product [marine sediment metagenome]|uniref:Uncharacterized protein n=1 Tax=marine sediment metagenome TaxID=412755 RepID=X1ASJ0_9ZZZZ
MLSGSVDPDDFRQGNEAKMDDQLMVKFFFKERENKEETLKQGRPIFKDVEYIEIRVAGKRDAQACRPATWADKNRFPRHYEAFEKRTEMPEEGTPLTQWPQISRSQVEEFAYMHVKTVEQLVDMSDTNCHKIHGGLLLKRRASEFLEASDATALIAEKEALQKRLADMEAKMEAILGAQDTPEEVVAVDQPEVQPAPKMTRARQRRTTAKVAD